MYVSLYCFAVVIYIFRKYCTMVRQIFIGPMIHTDENGELIIKESIAIFIEDGKVFNIYSIYSTYITFIIF